MSEIAAAIGITRLGQIAINAKDVERATAFYQDVLGLKLLFKVPPGLAFFDCGGVRLMLDRAEKPEFGSILCRARHQGSLRKDEGQGSAF